MSELEKVINNQMNNIDFGKLIEEAKDCLEAYDEFIHENIQNNPDKLRKLTPGVMMMPSLNTVFVINAILNHIGLTDNTLPLIAAGLSVLEKTLIANVDEEGKEIYQVTQRVLEKTLTSITYKKQKD